MSSRVPSGPRTTKKKKSVPKTPWATLAVGPLVLAALAGALWYPILTGRAHFKMPAGLGRHNHQQRHQHGRRPVSSPGPDQPPVPSRRR